MSKGPGKIRPEISRRIMSREVKEQILLNGLSPGLRQGTPKMPLSLIKRMAERKEVVWVKNRDLPMYNEELATCLLPSIDLLIKICPRKNVRFLDAGSGDAVLGIDLKILCPPKARDSKTVNYHAMALVESEVVKGVRVFDLSVDRLPRNSFDVIVSVQVFPYLGNKLRALESLCNALRVGGTLTIAQFGEIKVNNIYYHDSNAKNVERLKHYIELNNPHLEVRFVGHGGVLIRKLGPGETRIGLHFEGAELYSGELDFFKFAISKPEISQFHSHIISTYRI